MPLITKMNHKGLVTLEKIKVVAYNCGLEQGHAD